MGESFAVPSPLVSAKKPTVASNCWGLMSSVIELITFIRGRPSQKCAPQVLLLKSISEVETFFK